MNKLERKAYSLKWNKEHPEKVKEAIKKYRLKNKEKTKERLVASR